jgi:hypothetical protein
MRIGEAKMAARKKNHRHSAPRAPRGEAARRALADGIERSRALVERYRTLLVRLHDPGIGLAAALGRGHGRHLRRGGGSSG